MSKLLLWTIGNKVFDGKPSDRFKVKLDKLIQLYKEYESQYSEIEILISGRWGNITDDGYVSEARVGSDYIKNEIPDVKIIEEKISVESMGNFAFSKQNIIDRKADMVIGLIQSFIKDRVEHINKKIFADHI